ncbi:MAG: hypothetical protein R2813_13765 [Flavobacteriales bacterium]
MNKDNRTENPNAHNYLSQAYQYYQKLTSNFTGSNGYWELGCILDSMIDFLNLAVPAGLISLNDARSFLASAASNYQTRKLAGGWYDDWAWWANATGKIYDPRYHTLFENEPNLNMSFHQICFPNFQFIKNGVFPPDRPIADYYKAGTMNAYNYAKTEAEKNLGEGWESIVKGAQPVWNIGCWQAPMVPSGYSPQPSPTLDPADAGLGPFQDSVINGLFYLMVHRTFGQPNMGTKEDIGTQLNLRQD